MRITREDVEESTLTVPRVIGLCVAASVVIFGGLSAAGWLFLRAKADPTEAPVCYWANLANYTPLVQPIPPLGATNRGQPGIDRRLDQTSEETLRAAENGCKAGACERAGFEAYRSAIFWYLSPRLQHVRDLDRNYGEPGLRRAAEIYSDPFDQRIEKGLRDRYRAGVFRIRDFTQNEDAIAILVLKGGAALRPCRKTDRASK